MLIGSTCQLFPGGAYPAARDIAVIHPSAWLASHLVCVPSPASHASSQPATKLCTSLGNVWVHDLCLLYFQCSLTASHANLTWGKYRVSTQNQWLLFPKSIWTTYNLEIQFWTIDRAVKIRVAIWGLLNSKWLKISSNIHRLLLILSEVADTLY